MNAPTAPTTARPALATGTAVFRPDPLAGFGHLSRCLALAAAWMRVGGDATLWAPGVDRSWVDRWSAAGAIVTESAPTDACWWVVDDYGWAPSDADAGRRTLVVEDHPPASEILLRDEFRDAAPIRVAGDVRRVLLAPGGAPTDDVAAAFDDAARQLAAHAEVVWLRDTDDVVGAMRSVDLAVAAAGVTAYELARLGIPSVLVAVAGNQAPVLRRLVRAEAAAASTLHDLVDDALALAGDVDRRRALAAAAAGLVDGRGADRVVARMRSNDIVLRPATGDDAALLWKWANDPETRRQSLSTAEIPWDVHVAWLDTLLADPRAHAFVAEIDGVAVGSLRLDGRDGAAREGALRLSYSIAPEHRGQRLAAPLLIAATSWRTSGSGRVHGDPGPEVPGAPIVAEVRAGNVASRRAFELAGIPYEVIT